MLLGINKEDIKNAIQIETMSVFTDKMSLQKVYSRSHSHCTVGTRAKQYWSSARRQ